MNIQSLTDHFFEFGVLPVVTIEKPDSALPLADALLKGGLPVAEITFRTRAAEKSMRILRKNRPELLLGAGTVLTVEQLRKAKSAGAKFGLAPGFNPEIVKAAQEIDFPFFPGVLTPTEIERSIALGVGTVKFFPVEPSGGVRMLKSLEGPYGHCGLRFIPTGGVNPQNLKKYLALESVLAVGGTWIATKELIAEKKWDAISANAKAATTLAKKLRL